MVQRHAVKNLFGQRTLSLQLEAVNFEPLFFVEISDTFKLLILHPSIEGTSSSGPGSALFRVPIVNRVRH